MSASFQHRFASIVFQPPGDRFPGPRTVSIRITNGNVIRGCNAYIMESLALTLACKLRHAIRTSHPGSSLPIYTDCKSARHHALHPPPHPWTSTAYFLYNLLWKLGPTYDDLHWTPGHPERRTKDFSKWSDLECGNQLADMVAGPTPPSSIGTLYSITAREVLQFLLLDASWYIADGPLPLLISPLKVVQQANHQAYLLQRDIARQARGKAPKWSQLCLSRTSLWHSAVQAPYPLRARLTKLSYDWYIHGAKSTLSSTAPYPSCPPCPLCGEDDTRYHMLCGCDHPTVSAQRSTTLHQVSLYITSLVPHSTAHQLACAYRTLLDPLSFNEPHMVWAGTLTPAHLQTLQTQFPPLTEVIHPSHAAYTTLKKLAGMVLQGSLAILTARHSASSRMAYHRRRLYHHASSSETYRRNTYRPPARARRNCPTSLTHCIRPFPHSKPHSPSPPLNLPSTPHLHSTPLPFPPLITATPSSPASPPAQHTHSPTLRSPRPIDRLSPCTPSSRDLTQQSLDRYLSSDLGTPSTTLHSHLSLGTRVTLDNSDHRLFKLAQTNPTDPTIISSLSIPIPPSALSHLVSDGAAGWLCDLTISRIADIANAQLLPNQLAYHCLDGTFFSQLCQRQDDSYTLCYSDVRARFADWLEDRHPLNRSLICIPTNTTGSHWNGAFLFLDQRIILHVDSIRRDSLQARRRVISALRHWLERETETILSRPYNSPQFQHKLREIQDLSKWSYSCRSTPLQTNGNDCGVFYLMNLIYTLQHRQPTFSQTHIPLFRKQLFTAIVRNSLPPLNTPLSTNDTPFYISPSSLTPLMTLPPFPFLQNNSSDSSATLIDAHPPDIVYSSSTSSLPSPSHAINRIPNYPDLYPS